MTRPGQDRRKVYRIEGSGVPEKPPITDADFHHYAQWPQRLRNNIGNREAQTDDVSCQMQVIPIIEHLVSEIRRLKGPLITIGRRLEQEDIR